MREKGRKRPNRNSPKYNHLLRALWEIAFCSLHFVVFSKLSPVSMYDFHNLNKNNECCFKSTLRSRCDVKVWAVGEALVFWTSRPAPRATFPSQLSERTDKSTTEFKFHYQCHPPGLRRWGLQESRSLCQLPRGQGLQQEIKASFVVLSENLKIILESQGHCPYSQLIIGKVPSMPLKRGYDPLNLPAWARSCVRHETLCATTLSLSLGAFTFISQNYSGKALSCFHFGVEKQGIREVS